MKCDKCQLETLQNSTIITLLDKGWRVTSRCPRCGTQQSYEREGFNVNTTEHIQEAGSVGDDRDTTGHPNGPVQRTEELLHSQGRILIPVTGGTEANPCQEESSQETNSQSGLIKEDII